MSDDDELNEYVEDRPEPGRGRQRLLIIILSVGCLALAVSNVVLAMRVTELRRALVAERPAVAPAPRVDGPADAATPPAERATVAPAATVERPAASPAADTERPAPRPSAERTGDRPAEPEGRTASTAAPATTPAMSEPASPPAPKTEVEAPAAEPPNVGPPQRSRLREQARVATVTRTTDRPAAVPSSPERSTAAWMVQEYGRADAESRARAVAEFYSPHSRDGAYWRRVLAEITATRR